MSTKKFINKKHFMSALLYDKIHNEVFDIRLKQTQPSLFTIHFQHKNDESVVIEGLLEVHLTLDYRTLYAHLQLTEKVFIFEEEVDILPLPSLIIEAENFYYTMQHLVAINDMVGDFWMA